ncbi:MAG TPA: efflux RND transporter periplasmic adaptor subunit [Bryobacteraceae bacterium]|nr:efflux RND transporter periplasmic adaptor subunit [Bryobacteraceae bacterium]
MKNVIRILVIVAVLAAAGVGIVRSGYFKKEDRSVIRLSGNIELTEVDLAFKIPGRLVVLNLTEGTPVAKGAVVAQIDQANTLRQKDREEAGVVAANAQLGQTLTGIQHQREAVEGEIQVRRAEVRNAEAHLAELLSGARPQEVQTAKAQLEDTKTWADQAQRDWERAQVLYKDEDISTAQLEQYRAKFDSASQAHRQARERLALVMEGARKETIEAARAQVERATATLRLAEASRIDLKRREQEVDVRRAEISRAKAGVSMLDAQLDDTTLIAPISGMVLVKSAERGEVLAAGAKVATIGDLTHPWLRAYIGEKDLGRVKLGAKVKLTTDSFPGKVYWGTITYIASEAEFTPKQIQTRDERVKLVYRIKVEVDNPNQELKANMPVDAEIVL